MSHIRPIVRRDDEVVVTWVFRLTLTEGGQSAFNDIYVDLPEHDRRLFAAWRQGEIRALCDGVVADQGPRVVGLHQVLDHRLAVVERHDLSIESLPE